MITIIKPLSFTSSCALHFRNILRSFFNVDSKFKCSQKLKPSFHFVLEIRSAGECQFMGKLSQLYNYTDVMSSVKMHIIRNNDSILSATPLHRLAAIVSTCIIHRERSFHPNNDKCQISHSVRNNYPKSYITNTY